MPGKKHVKEWSVKRNRQYEHILKSLRESHPDWSEDKLKEMAARTVNKIRAEKGETKKSTTHQVMYHTTSVGNLDNIKQHGLVGGHSSGYTKEGHWADKYYGARPTYLSREPFLAGPNKVALAIDVSGYRLLPDLPSLIDYGAYLDEDMIYWETPPDGSSIAKEASEGVEIDELLSDPEYSEWAINLTGTAAVIDPIPASRILFTSDDGHIMSSYNPIVDGPNPNGPNYLDNAENSYEQQLALQLWVNYAVELLNAGDEDKVILAKLTRAGCPNPQDVLLRAKMQPFEEPEQEVNTDMLPDEDNISPTAPVSTPDAEVNTTAPARQLSHKVRIKGSSETGTIIDMWHDVWGQSLIKVALDSGGTINVAPDAVEQYEDVIEVPHPVTQIQEFIDSLPEVKPTRPHIEARIANMELVRRAVADNINKVGLSDRVKLDKIDMDARAEIGMLKEALKNICDETDLIYLNSLPIYQTHGISHPGVKRVVVQDEDFNNKIAEKAAIFVSELPQQLIEDPQSVAYAAFQYATANNGDAKRFMALVEEKRVARVALKNKEN
ncbi:MAG: hypothetical protein QXU32_02390 [Nitrososphaerales archaeon]